MKNVVVSFQHENWEDDGGDHDPKLYSVSDEMFDRLEKLEGMDEVYSEDFEDIVLSPSPELPCTLDGVFNIWYKY